MKAFSFLATILFSAALSNAQAEITVGVTLSATGPAASLGIPEKNMIALLPKTLGNEMVTYVVLDDATDPTIAAKNVQKLVFESKIDVLIGSSTVPTCLAAARVAAESRTPVLAMAPFNTPPEIAPWVFQTAQSVALVARVVVGHMKSAGISSIGFIGFNDAYGESWWSSLNQQAEAAGIKVVANERFNRSDTSVIGQALKIIGARPDAVFIAGSGTPSALPEITLVEKGYKGKFYQSAGSTNLDFIRVGGKAVEGTILPAAPMLVAEQLADNNPAKQPAMDMIRLYEGAHGANSRSVFAGLAYDAYLLLQKAVPEALKKAKPGTAEFRQALRDALEGIKEMPATYGVFNLSSSNHNGLDERAVVMIMVEGGTWKLIR